MNWNASVDAYCERLEPGFWDEPLNAISNLAFWLSAWLVWRGWQAQLVAAHGPIRPGLRPLVDGIGVSAEGTTPASVETRRWDISTLLTLQLLIGAGSFAFHTFATRWAGALDVLFIAMYLHFYVAVYAHRVLAVPWPRAWLGVLAFALVSRLAALTWERAAVLVGEPAFTGAGAAGGYLGAWTVLLLLLAHSAWRRLALARHLAGAAAVFAVSLCLRQLDLPLCGAWPWGTHFAWHLLNATTLGLTSWALANTDGGAITESPRTS